LHERDDLQVQQLSHPALAHTPWLGKVGSIYRTG
jgi:hypothetical protein